MREELSTPLCRALGIDYPIKPAGDIVCDGYLRIHIPLTGSRRSSCFLGDCRPISHLI